MHNGIKKYVIASIPIIFGCLFGYGNAYNVIESCTRNSFCVEFEANETVNYDTLNFQGQKGTTNIELSTDTYNNVLAYKFNSNSDKFMTYAYYWSEQGFTTYAGYHGGGSYNINKQTYVCTNTATGYTGCLMEDTSSLWNSTGNLASSDILTENFTANKYVINLYNKGRGSYGPSTFCMIDTTNDMSICIKNDYYTAGDRPRQTLLQTGTNDNSVLYIDSLYTLLTTSVPPTNTPIAGGGGGGGETTPIIYTGTITNQHAIYAYEQLGLTPQQCYGGYPIDTIYNTGNILYQGYQAGTGASILDLYNLYSGNYNGYQSTYMTEEQTKISQFLSEIYQGYENNGQSFFIGKPEALITIIQQYNNANQKAIEKGRGYSLYQLYTYCDLLINHNNNEEYTGNTATPDMRRNGIDTENQEIVLPATGSVFDELQQDGEFKRNKAQDIRDTINSVYTKLTKIFNLRGGVEGIIPDYITRILLLIILLAIFKK